MKHYTKEELIAFEQKIVGIFNEGELPFLLHLAGGNEDQLIDIFAGINEGDWILGSHRSHLHYLLAGGTREDLEQKIRDGRSMFLFNRKLNFLTSAILAGTCGIAAGIAWSLKEAGSKARVHCFLGDASEEQGHFYESALFVEAQELPCTFVVENNFRQVDTDLVTRRGTAKTAQRPLGHFACVRHYDYIPRFPHAGRGAGPQITFKPEVVEQFAKRAKSDVSR